MPVLSPHPPVGPKTNRGHSVLVDEGHSSPTTLVSHIKYGHARSVRINLEFLITLRKNTLWLHVCIIL